MHRAGFPVSAAHLKSVNLQLGTLGCSHWAARELIKVSLSCQGLCMLFQETEHFGGSSEAKVIK